MTMHGAEPTDDELEALRAQHGEVHVLRAGDVALVVRRPSRAERKRLARVRAALLREARQILTGCVVHPPRALVASALAANPEDAVPFLDALATLIDSDGGSDG